MKRSQRAASRGSSAALRETLRLIPGYDAFKTARDSWLDEDAARQAIDFFHECLKHIEGAEAGKPFLLERWQQAIIGNLFGWKRKDAKGRVVRRYRELFLYVPRKNGKTPLAAGICNYVLFCDPERGKQIYGAAAEKEQAALLYRQAKGMIEQEPELARRARVYKAHKSIVLTDDEASVYRVLSADADTKHGGTPTLVLIDELHAQPNRELVDVLQTSMASANRLQPLLIHITTADFQRESICNEKHDHASKVRDGVIEDEAFLPVIYEASKDDDWKDPNTWAKANPNLGVSVSLEYLERACKHAQDVPAYENTFKRLHLDIQTEQDVRWLSMSSWDGCAGLHDDETPRQWRARVAKEMRGRRCIVGLDMSAKVDTTCATLIFPPVAPAEPWRILPYFWIPAETADLKERRDRVPYSAWGREGFLELTDGNEVDSQRIRTWINQAARDFDVQTIGYDDWNATELSRQLREEDGFEDRMVIVRQGSKTLSDPMKEIEAMVLARRLEHGGNPVMRAQMANVAAKVDENENIRPNKAKSTGRIDGPVSLITGMAPALTEGDATSVYESRGLLTL